MAAFLAAFPAAVEASAASSAASDTPSSPSAAGAVASGSSPMPSASAPPPPLPDDLFPVISSVKDLNAFASVVSLPSTKFIPRTTGRSTFISPCPIVAFRLSNWSLRILT